jgi:histidinol-phosphate aminotransferase
LSIERVKPHLKEIVRVPNLEIGRLRYIRLDKNERTTPFTEKIWQEMLRGLGSNSLTTYPETGQLKAAIGNWTGLSTDEVFLTAGSDLAIKACFETFVSPGDEFVFLSPTFAMVEVYAKLFQAKAVPCPSGPELEANADLLLNSITEKTALVYIANPNSPTGTLMQEMDLEKILERAHQTKTAVLIDEAYFGFCEYTALPLLNRWPSLLICRTLSKSIGVAGIRVGFLAGNASLIEQVSKWRPMYEVNCLGVHFGTYILENIDVVHEYISQVNEAKEAIYRWGAQKNIRTFRSHANFVNVMIGEQKAATVSEECMKRKILLRCAGNTPTLSECIRISCGTPEQVHPALDIISANLSGG